MKKRVLLVNKFYYSRGGDCVCAMNLENLLKSQGWDVAVFAMKYPENVASEYEDYFASEIGFNGGLHAKLNAAKRLLGYGDVKKSFKRILNDFRPDVVHLHNIHSYISPIVAKIAKEFGCRVVWTLHDYKLICPSYTCLRDGKPCEACSNNKVGVLKYRCMKGSLAASVLAYMEAMKWNRDWLERYVDAFVCPSSFMARKMGQAGFDKSKLHVVCNFIDSIKLETLSEAGTAERESYYLYVGRLSKEKGVETLLKVAANLPYKLKIAGGGPLLDGLRKQFEEYEHIEFLGHQNAVQVARLLSKAVASVVPSECYENNPLSVIESLCAGTPVVGANIGGIPELINDSNGVIFESCNIASLEESIKSVFEREWNYEKIGDISRKSFSSKKYMESIKNIYL